MTQLDKKQITSVLGSQSLLTLGSAYALLLLAFNPYGLNCFHHLQGLGQSEVRGQGRGCAFLGQWWHRSTCHAPVLAFLFSVSACDWVKIAWMTYKNMGKHTFQYIKKGGILFRTQLQCKRHIYIQILHNLQLKLKKADWCCKFNWK